MTVMSATLTIPADDILETALREQAEAQGKTVPEMAREILTQVLLERPLGKRTGHLRGKLELPTEPSDSWRGEIHFVAVSSEGPRNLAEFVTASDMEVHDFAQPDELGMEKYADSPMDNADATLITWPSTPGLV